MAKIVCVEDESDLREIIAEELTDAGYEVIQAADGVEGLAAILLNRPDLVISDITMPSMTGIEMLKELHALEAHKDYPVYAEIPFIFLSALSERDDVLHGMELGADDYLTKPVDFDMLLAKIKTNLRQINRIRMKRQRILRTYLSQAIV